MPRTLPLPVEEKAIGLRLREVRESLLIPRTSMAVKLGISTERLVSYEFGRVKLPWGVARDVSKQFHLNLIWLTNGKGPQFYPNCLQTFNAAKPAFNPDEKQPFSAVMAELLDEVPKLRTWVEMGGHSNVYEVPNTIAIQHLTEGQRRSIEEFTRTAIVPWIVDLDVNQTKSFFTELGIAGDGIASKFPPPRKQFQGP